jgi:hypothetical protein
MAEKQVGASDAEAVVAGQVAAEDTGVQGTVPEAAAPASDRAVRFSGTVHAAGRGLPGACTAIEIAIAIDARHPGEYGAGRLSAALADATTASLPLRSQSWPAWRTEVGRLFDPDAVAASSHQVVDGRLFIAGLGVVDSAFRACLEESGLWHLLLFELDDAAVSSGPLRALLDGLCFAHGYVSDASAGEDQLGIEGEVDALCRVVTDPLVRPPLAVGLFGEWGSGKTFFMDKMRERIAAAGRPGVVQIRFNAWHYSDASLWASLAVTIFERLVDPEPVWPEDRDAWLAGQGDPLKEERAALLEDLETYRLVRAASEAQVHRLEEQRGTVADQLDDAIRRQEEAKQQARPMALARAVAENAGVRDAVGRVATALGFQPRVQELRDINRQLQSTSGYVLATWRRVRHKSLAALLITAAVLLALVTPGLVAHGGTAALGSIGTAIGSAVAVITSFTKLLHPAACKVDAAVAEVQRAIGFVEEVQDELRSERRLAERELRALDREIEHAGAQLAELDGRIAAAQARAQSLSVGRQLYDFLSERATGYRAQQGIVGMLHRDFQLLDAKLRAARSQADGRAVERIVLYVDDLDRCPPAKVLEVLEAVHLLLALELFVVVVGVDPRWLQRSLRHQYRRLATAGGSGADDYLRAMPVEYLEKIFQIPLTLPAMQVQAFASLVGSLAPAVPSLDVPPDTDQPKGIRLRNAAREEPGTEPIPTRASLTAGGASAAPSQQASIDLTAAEVARAQKLGPLIDSPRAAKRLMNTYRLIRATQRVDSRSRFLGSDGKPGSYIPLLTLLAVTAGYPTVADRLLAALELESNDAKSWTEFLGGQLAQAAPQDAIWRNLLTALQQIRSGGVNDIAQYRRWGPLAARFSFTL